MDEVEQLEQRIADLKARLPRHSVPPQMLIELEELEEQLRQAKAAGDKERG
jgi:cell division septum initiation protein DivIVA